MLQKVTRKHCQVCRSCMEGASFSMCASFVEGLHCANDLLYDSVFYSVYSNIPLKYTHLRIEPYTRVRILKYNRSRDIHGRLASL